MPQLDPATFPTQLFWLAVVFVVLLILMARVGLPRVREVVETRAAILPGMETHFALYYANHLPPRQIAQFKLMSSGELMTGKSADDAATGPVVPSFLSLSACFQTK